MRKEPSLSDPPISVWHFTKAKGVAPILTLNVIQASTLKDLFPCGYGVLLRSRHGDVPVLGQVETENQQSKDSLREGARGHPGLHETVSKNEEWPP